MCGLVGVAANKLGVQERKLFKTMLFLDQIRGEHSTGVCAVERDGSVSVHKRALPAADFLQLKKATDVITDADHLLIGHNRYATIGSHTDDNAHPFQHEHITLAHNGTLKVKGNVNKDSATFSTDSETIAYAFSTEAEREVLERLDGAYALTWHDATDNTINLARNEERPLFVGHTVDGIVWASQKELIELAAAHCKVNVSKIEQLPVGEWRYWKLGDIKGGHKTVEFTPKKPVSTTTTTKTSPAWRGTTVSRTTANSRINTMTTMMVEELRDSGYCTGHNLDGNAIIVHLTRDDVPRLRALESPVIHGKIVNESKTFKGGVMTTQYTLSALNLKFQTEDEWLEDWAKSELEPKDNKEEANAPKKKCFLCHDPITTKAVGEYHFGEYFHTKCLDEDSVNAHNSFGGYYD